MKEIEVVVAGRREVEGNVHGDTEQAASLVVAEGGAQVQRVGLLHVVLYPHLA